LFSSARVRVCVEKYEKKRKIAGNGISGRFKAMFEIVVICKRDKNAETDFHQLF
jgi:hypothetical protein